MENVIVAFSNLPVIYPLYGLFKRQDWITFVCLTCAGFASFVSHLVENHKHGMPGFLSVSTTTSIFWNNVDRTFVFLCAFLFVFRYLPLIYHTFDYKGIHVLLALTTISMLNLISEYNKFNSNLKWMFVHVHCLWHISVFIMVGYIVNFID